MSFRYSTPDPTNKPVVCNSPRAATTRFAPFGCTAAARMAPPILGDQLDMSCGMMGFGGGGGRQGCFCLPCNGVARAARPDDRDSSCADRRRWRGAPVVVTADGGGRCVRKELEPTGARRGRKQQDRVDYTHIQPVDWMPKGLARLRSLLRRNDDGSSLSPRRMGAAR